MEVCILSETIIRGLNLNGFKTKDINNWSKNLNENDKLTEGEVIQIFRTIYNRNISINYGIVRQILSNANDFDYKKIFTNEVGVELTAEHYLLLIGKKKIPMMGYFINKTLQNFLPEFIINYFPPSNDKEHYMTEIDEKILSTMLDAFNIPVNLKEMHNGISIGKTSLSLILNSFTPNFISKITLHILLNYQQYDKNKENDKFIDSDTANQLCKDNTFFSSTQQIEWIEPMLNAFQDNSIPFTIFINFFNSCFSNNIEAKEGILDKLLTKTAQDFVTSENYSQLKYSLNNKTLDVNIFVKLFLKFQNNSLSDDFFDDDLKLKFTGKLENNKLPEILNKFNGKKVDIGYTFFSLINKNTNENIMQEMINYLNTLNEQNNIEENPSSEQSQIQEQNLIQQYNFNGIKSQEAFISYIINHQGKISSEEFLALRNYVNMNFIDLHINWTKETSQNFFGNFTPGTIDNCDFLQKLFQNQFQEALDNTTLKIISTAIKPKTINTSCTNSILPNIFSNKRSGAMDNHTLSLFCNMFENNSLPVIINIRPKARLSNISILDIIFENGFDGMITRNTLNIFLSSFPENNLDYQTKIKILSNGNRQGTLSFAEFINNNIYTQDKISESDLLLIAKSAVVNTLDLYPNFVPESLSFPTFAVLFQKMNKNKKGNIELILTMLGKVTTDADKDKAMQILRESNQLLVTEKQQLVTEKQQLETEKQGLEIKNQNLQEQINRDYVIARSNVEKFRKNNEAKITKTEKYAFYSKFGIVGGALITILGIFSIPFSFLTFGLGTPLTVGLIMGGSTITSSFIYNLFKYISKIIKYQTNFNKSENILSQNPTNISLNNSINEKDPTVLRRYLEICCLRSLLENSQQIQPQQQIQEIV